MGDFNTILVDFTVSLDNSLHVAGRMMSWLQAKCIVGPPEVEEEYAHASAGSYSKVENIVYRPGPNFREASEDDRPLRLSYNYLEITTERTIFTAGDNGIGIYCTKCSTEQTELGHAWNDAFQTWFEGHPEPLTCVRCGYAAHLSGWRFDPVFGFGNLGFRFCNWFLRPTFIQAFERELGRPLTVVHEHP
jgi:Zn ribbon nucleic-acid-binding protein